MNILKNLGISLLIVILFIISFLIAGLILSFGYSFIEWLISIGIEIKFIIGAAIFILFWLLVFSFINNTDSW